MPNWCECDLEVEGPSEKVDEFLKFAEGENPFDFNKFIPYPDEFARLDEIAEAWAKQQGDLRKADWSTRPKDGFNSGGHEWCVQNWGTKWPAYHFEEVAKSVSHHDGGTTLVDFHFDTAWSPPLPVIEKAAALFPMLTFDLRYYECGASFHGAYCFENGKCVRDESGPYFGNRGG